MFTGIVQEQGTVVSVTRGQGLARLVVSAPKTASRIEPLDSIAVNGVCLSVTEVRGHALNVEVIPETQQRTTLARLRAGVRVNLEPSLTLTDRLNGHLVLGHVDGVGTVIAHRHRAGELRLTIRLPRELRVLLVPKGPIAVDGVSLTVGQELTRSAFTVHLIPETLRQTTLRELAVGDSVNLELDYLAKLTRQFLLARLPSARRRTSTRPMPSNLG
jgi:riboflavin synthase